MICLASQYPGAAFAGEDISPRHSGLPAVLDQRQILVDDVHHVEQLPLVGVDALHLNIEEGIRIDVEPSDILE